MGSNNASDQGRSDLKPDPAEPEKEGTEQHLQPLIPPKSVLSDYRKTFLPFQPPSHTILAPVNLLASKTMDETRKLEEFDKVFGSERDEVIDVDVPSLKTRFSDHDTNLQFDTYLSMRDIMAQIQGDISHPIDLTSTQDDVLMRNPTELLRSVSMKHLQFQEDVRPPYHGTYTKPFSTSELRKVARNPFTRLRRDTDYDYDSEAEWEEPEEGEDLESEGEEDTESLNGPDEMDGFLDDEDTADGTKSKRRLISGDLEPLSTGLCWEDKDGGLKPSAATEHTADFREYRMKFLISVLF